MIRFTTLLLTLFSVALPAAAQLTTTIDDSVAFMQSSAPTPLSGGTGSGFGGQLGVASGQTVEISWDSDVLERTGFRMQNANCGTANVDVIVLYLDTEPSAGFADTTSFSDTSSLEASAVSATPLGATLTFAAGFAADYAIAIQNNAASASAFLYDLSNGGPHVVSALTVVRLTGSCQLIRVTDLSLADLGASRGDDVLSERPDTSLTL